MRLKGTVYVMGRVGPFSIATDEALETIRERLSTPGEHVIPVRLGRLIVSGRLVSLERVNATPDTPGLELIVDLDETDVPPELLDSLRGTQITAGDKMEEGR
jgi:hypothetical protein